MSTKTPAAPSLTPRLCSTGRNPSSPSALRFVRLLAIVADARVGVCMQTFGGTNPSLRVSDLQPQRVQGLLPGQSDAARRGGNAPEDLSPEEQGRSPRQRPPRYRHSVHRDQLGADQHLSHQNLYQTNMASFVSGCKYSLGAAFIQQEPAEAISENTKNGLHKHLNIPINS